MSKNRLVIFAHYDKDNLIDDYVIYYLSGLKKVANDILFVSDCDLKKDELKKLDGLCFNHIVGMHGEYDFGSYKRGIMAMEDKLSNYDELVLANDSCYGPIHPFENVFTEMDNKECDFWGLTCSNESTGEYYVGSYFLAFKPKVFLSDVFKQFFCNIKKLENKKDIILNYEIGLSVLLKKQGFLMGSFSKKYDVMPLVDKKVFYLFEQGFPLLKIDLLKNNPLQIKNVYRWKFYCPSYIITMIEKHLKRITGKDNLTMWYLKINPFKIIIIHKKLIRIIYKNKILRIKIFGLVIFKKHFES